MLIGTSPSPEAIDKGLFEAAAAKNNEWADFYLSTAATDGSIAGFLSIKAPLRVRLTSLLTRSEERRVVKEGRDPDAEYFYNFIPAAVRESTDGAYKELLAVYNALRFWIAQGLVPGTLSFPFPSPTPPRHPRPRQEHPALRHGRGSGLTPQKGQGQGKPGASKGRL